MADSTPAIILLSGGLDSATVLAIASAQGYDCHALTFDYGQRHTIELNAAKAIAAAHNLSHHTIINLDLRTIGASALTADDIDVPKDRAHQDITNNIPVTYVPARNTIFLSYALALAEAQQIHNIFIGVNEIDYSGYPDCRPEFIAAFQHLANVATATDTPITIHTPLANMTKADIIKAGLALNVDYALTHSCYDPAPDGRPCRRCDSCRLRAAGFAAAGCSDPALSRDV